MSEALRALADRGDLRRYRKGTLLMEEGSQGDTMHIVLAGRVRAYSIGRNDREITYGVYGPGEYVGEMSCIDGGARAANVIAVEATTCSVVTRQTLRDHVSTRADFALELLDRVVRRARLATGSARSMALLDVYGRVVGLLEELALEQPDGSRLVAGRLTHAEIAARIGCSREMVSRLMKDLQRGGYLALEPGGLRLPRRLPPRW